MRLYHRIVAVITLEALFAAQLPVVGAWEAAEGAGQTKQAEALTAAGPAAAASLAATEQPGQTAAGAGTSPRSPESAPEIPASAVPAVAVAEITPEAGGVVELDGVRLEVPAGAVREPVRITIGRLAATEPLNEGLANVTAGARGYRFSPPGLSFACAVRISLPFDPCLLESETALSNLFSYFYDRRHGRWERLERVGIDRERALVISSSGHFTDMINATLALPEAPGPLSFDVNAIKSLEAADPSAGVPAPEGLEPGPFGAASFRLPLRLPPGRGGVAPQLALSYSSEAAGGWLGRGFDIQVPALSTDTRFGLPRYDGADRYMLEGEELVYVGSEGEARRYSPRTERSFRRIRWYRGGEEDYWQVTEKSGLVREYGRGEGWLGPQRGQRSRTYLWYLTMERDVYGNTVRYRYWYDEQNRATYLAEIRYTGFEAEGGSEEGAYRLAFLLGEREDRRIDSRGTFISKLARRLERIDLYYGEERIRSYLFGYRANEFGQSLLDSFGEADGQGTRFYTYRFDYYGLPELRSEQGELEGYAGFGEAERQWGAVYNERFKGLGDSCSASAGGSLYAGIQIYIWIPFLGKEEIFSLGVRGGIGFTTGALRGMLLDVNGDGLADAVWKEGEDLAAYLNRGEGFEVSSVFRLPGLEGVLDQEKQLTFSLGAEAAFGPAKGAICWQHSWSEAKTGFADVNGDGFPDFLKADSSTFARNTGSSFVSTTWRLQDSGGSGGEMGGDAEEDNFRRTYYRQEPLRRWKAYRSGTVEVAHEAKLCRPQAASEDGAELHIYGSGQTHTLSLGRDQAQAEGAGSYTVQEGESLYFHLDTGVQEAGDEVDWNVRIRYTAVDLFEDMGKTALYQPVERTSGRLPYGGDGRLEPIYTKSKKERDDGSAIWIYTLKDNWQSLEEEVLGPVYEALTEHCAFVPLRIPRQLFERLYAQAAATGETVLVENPQAPGSMIEVQIEALLLEGYGYVAETETLVRLNAYGDEEVKRFLDILTLAERRGIAMYRWLDGGYLVPGKGAGGGASHTETAPPVKPPPELLADAREALPGSTVLDKGILLDEGRAEAADLQPQERLWLRRDGQGVWQLVRERDEGQEERLEAGLDVWGSDPLELRCLDRSLERSFLLTGGSSLIERLPAEVYEGAVTEQVLGGEGFSALAYTPLSAQVWAALQAGLSEEEQALLSSCYEPDGDGYRLAEGIGAEQLAGVLRLLNGLAEVPGSLFDLLPGDPQALRRLVLLSAGELQTFSAGGPEGVGELFGSFSDEQGSGYYLRRDLDEGQRSLLVEAMAAYRRDRELFPYYEPEPAAGAWVLKSGLSEEQQALVAETLAACGLQVWGSLVRAITYRAGTLLTVEPGSLPEGGEEEPFAPAGSLGLPAGRETGVVTVPLFASQGRTVLKRCYIHLFDSLRDYSAQELISYPEEYGHTGELEVFGGGVYGWFYGLWSGYHEWSEQKLYELPGKPPSGEVTPPPYFEAMQPNRDGEGNLRIDTDGSGRQVPAEAWIGPVSSYSEASLDEDYRPVYEERRFAAFIAGDRLHPGRKGGDAYYRIPRQSGVGSGDKLEFVRTARSEAEDKNGGVSLYGMGADFSSNTGSSWQYQALLDLNGDRYLDAVSLPDDKEGAGSFAVSPGTGDGFAERRHYSTPFRHLARYENESYGFGASAGSPSGGTRVRYGANGKPVQSTVQEPEADGSGGGIGAGAGENGTIGSSFQSEGLVDMNGDGLPDHVRRSGTGDYWVALNTGAGAFAEPVSWGAGMRMSLFEGLDRLATDPRGLSHSMNGSFGVSAGVSAGIGVVGAGASAGFAATVSRRYSALVDMNGDGLADQVAKDSEEGFFRVRYNLGDRFSEQELRLFRPEWEFSLTDALRAAVAADLDVLAGLMGGLSLPSGCGIPGFAGLPSQQANPFGGLVDPFSIEDVLEYTGGASFNLGANISFKWAPFLLLVLSLVPGVNGSIASTNATLRLADIDGDGLADHVAKLPGEEFLRVKRNGAGRAGLLKTVHLPQGGRWELEYERAGNTVALPQCRWVLSALVKDNGLEGLASDRGEHRYLERYEYEEGYYDRAERLFYGFAAVSTRYADGGKRIVRYHNRDYHRRGMVHASELWGPDAAGMLQRYRETDTVVQERSEGWYGDGDKEVVFPAVTAERIRVYEAGTQRYAESGTLYGYDEYGNVESLVEEGDRQEQGDELYAWIEYADPGGYLKQHPESLQVEDAGGRLLRYRRGEYGQRGELLRLQRYESEGQFHTYRLSWDRYGNLASIEDPRGYRLSWEYDTEVHGYPTVIRSDNPALGGGSYASRLSWDLRFGRETERVDVNGQSMRLGYDSHGRLVEVRSPYDSGSLSAVRHQYLSSELPWRAVTQNKLLYDPLDQQSLRTLVTADGLGRTAQTAKQGELWAAGQRRAGWNCSGAVAYDGKGRVVAEGQPVFVEGEELPGLVEMSRASTRAYDVLDRVVEQVLPDGARWSWSYGVREGRRLEVGSDALGNLSERELDGRGNVRELRKLNGAGVLLSSAGYRYNVLGEILEVIDRAGNLVRSGYDLLGRRLSLESPDGGRIEYHYDEAGNLVRKTDSNLRRRGESIEYRYDGHNRLVEIDYPRTADVRYVYGEPGAAEHGAGRLVERRDESGRVRYRYGKLGELAGMDRRIQRLTPLAEAVDASFGYGYDYLGRLQRISYPDGEVVSYEYDRGGQVRAVLGMHYGRETVYVAEIGYDEFAQRVYLEYGNGVRSSYSYDENRRWLSGMHTESGSGTVHQGMSYRFDAVGNVLEVANRAGRYETLQSYGYDDLYQLVEAEGTSSYRPYGLSEYSSSYGQQFAFDGIGNMTRKMSSVRTTPKREVGAPLNYLLDYQYYEGKAHQAERIGDLWYRYDGNGNVIEEREGGHALAPLSEAELWKLGEVRVVNRGFGLTREQGQEQDVYARYYVWDEENRLRRSVEASLTVEYRYGADGRRALKYSERGERLYFDAMWQVATDYPDLRRSKHIYVGRQRVATRLNIEGYPDAGYEELNTYTYHGDHLGSAQVVSDYQGREYERMEYTPYGELWIEQQSDVEARADFPLIPALFSVQFPAI